MSAASRPAPRQHRIAAWFTKLGKTIRLLPQELRPDDYEMSYLRLRLRKGLRYTQIILIALACFALLMAVSMVVGCGISDLHINSHLASTYARVESTERSTRYVSFVDRDGNVQNPRNGVLYPTGVREGQLVRVDYDYTNPNYARISGRSWTLSIVPAVSLLVCVLPWIALAYCVIGRYRIRAGGIIRRTHFGGTIAGIHVNQSRTILRMRAATALPTKRVT
ncbi:DUF3592 domain-containing protein [Lawsonella clevelandensis]|uniref:DUF3592 domain-containing protein n=1 Tax=Lawsonella clevelandensis TaxID=1528099 RepID=UPI0032D992DB